MAYYLSNDIRYLMLSDPLTASQVASLTAATADYDAGTWGSGAAAEDGSAPVLTVAGVAMRMMDIKDDVVGPSVAITEEYDQIERMSGGSGGGRRYDQGFLTFEAAFRWWIPELTATDVLSLKRERRSIRFLHLVRAKPDGTVGEQIRALVSVRRGNEEPAPTGDLVEAITLQNRGNEPKWANWP